MANYGTVNSAEGRNGHPNNSSNAERAALIGNKSEDSPGFVTLCSKHLGCNVSKTWGDIALLFCYIITGLLDSSSIFIWGSFVSMQTGNTVYVGLGIVDPGASTRWIRSGVSIGCFCLGSLFFSAYHRTLSPRKRWVIVSSYTLQNLMILAAALMTTFGPHSGKQDHVDAWVLIPIGAMAFQSAGQAVMSRVLQYGGLTSVVLTSNYCDLFGDPKLLAGFAKNPERNRRIAAPLLLVFGAILGGLWSHSSWGIAGALW
ncbi:hypothetical protein MBLNU230_g1359t2 [Neophaeotheca triangularis]